MRRLLVLEIILTCKVLLVLLIVRVSSSSSSSSSTSALNKMLNDDPVDINKHLPAQVVWTVLNEDVELPCDITPPNPTENVAMVLWFKDTSGVPFYSLDSRGGPLDNGTHWTTSTGLGSRSLFIATHDKSKAKLRISHVQAADEGVFRCRVDFFASPTRNSRLNLTLVVAPSSPRIFDAQGHEITTRMAGPFLEGYDLFLSCQVTGGRPEPTVKWYRAGNIMVDGVVDTSADSSTTVNQLIISKLPRSYHNTTLECRAQASFQAAPLIRRVNITVYLKPEDVKIVTPNKLLSIHDHHLIRCEAYGAYPPADIFWYLDGELINNSTIAHTKNGNTSSSLLSLKVSISDDGKDLGCKAKNPRFSEGYREDHRTIHVSYPPAVYVVADSTIDSSNLKEGTEVKLFCEAHANPPPYKYQWYLGDTLLSDSFSENVIPENKQLTLRNLSKSLSGEYRCAAINTEGETRSIPFKLKVLYAPSCREEYTSRRIAVFQHDNVLAHCEVEADPPNVKFSWTYNNSLGNFLPVQGSRIVSNGLVSQLHYKPIAPNDYGTLACWASNSVGNQKTPCYFHIIPGHPPSPPKECEIKQSHYNGVEITCLPDSDGGLKQYFTLQVIEEVISSQDRAVNDQAIDTSQQSNSPLYQIDRPDPFFKIHDLRPGREYNFLIYAVNPKGKSNPAVQFSNIRIQPPVEERHFEPEPTGLSISTATITSTSSNSDTPNSSSYLPMISQNKLVLFGLAGAGVFLLMLLANVIFIVIRVRKKRRKPPNTPRQTPSKIAEHYGNDIMIIEEEDEYSDQDERRPKDEECMIDLNMVKMRRNPCGGTAFNEHSFMRHDPYDCTMMIASSSTLPRKHSASIEPGLPISRRISQHLAIDHPDLILVH